MTNYAQALVLTNPSTAEDVISRLDGAAILIESCGWTRHPGDDERFTLLESIVCGYDWDATSILAARAVRFQIENDYSEPFEHIIRLTYSTHNATAGPDLADWNSRQRDRRKVLRLINRTILNIEKALEEA